MKEIMLSLHHISYVHPDRETLFEDISLTIADHQKVAIVGNNGSGKSTLLRIMAGDLQPASGTIRTDSPAYYVPQHFGQFNSLTVAQALRIDHKLNALKSILDGDVRASRFADLDDDWSIGERCREALSAWSLTDLDPDVRMDRLSGGEKTRVFLAGIGIHTPRTVLLDEPGNHMDGDGRAQLYEYLLKARESIVVVSHDRTMLNLFEQIYELDRNGITVYGGNYDFYATQKAAGLEALAQDLKDREKALRKAKAIEREAMERKQRLDARGRKKADAAGIPTIAINTLRNNAERSTSRMKEAHAGKIGSLVGEVTELRQAQPDKDAMKLGFDDTLLHRGKILVKAKEITFGYGETPLTQRPLSFEIRSGSRVAIKGGNGTGKTSLIRVMLGSLAPLSGTVVLAPVRHIYIDQDYALVQSQRTVYEQALAFNTGGLQEHEIKSRLTRFLFTSSYWDQRCDTLSGGEKMRLVLCCLSIRPEAPDLIVLDEPTNNLDIRNTEILTAAIQEYGGTLLVVSHDEVFLEEIGIDETIDMK